MLNKVGLTIERSDTPNTIFCKLLLSVFITTMVKSGKRYIEFPCLLEGTVFCYVGTTTCNPPNNHQSYRSQTLQL